MKLASRTLPAAFIAVLFLSACAGSTPKPAPGPETSGATSRAGTPVAGAESELREGLDFYRRNELSQALPHLERAVAADPTNLETAAWLAETCRRLDRTDEAMDLATSILAADSCFAVAHEIIGDICNNAFRQGIEALRDAAWDHYLRSAACDPRSGGPWLSIWSLAIQRGDQDREREALRRIGETGFVTPAMLSYARWMLRDLPENAVLLSNGDMDTYPPLVLQEKEGFRPDVLIVNLSLLNTDWYAASFRERYDLPFPTGDLHAYRTNDGDVRFASRQRMDAYIEALDAGETDRPLAAAVTIPDLDRATGAGDRFVFCGSYFLYRENARAGDMDVETARRTLEGVRPADFPPPVTSPQDRSPVRIVGGPGLIDNITAAALRTALALAQTGRIEEARATLEWAREFSAGTPGARNWSETFSKVEQIMDSAGK